MSEVTTQPRRRWFRFGLRTMFVILTVVALAFTGNGEVRRVWDRQEALYGVEPIFSDNSRIPVWRRWLGDRPVHAIYVNPADPNKERIRSLFPEATLLDVPPPK